MTSLNMKVILVVWLLQAQVTDLVLQRFPSAEPADLPALLRFLLQHVDSHNASQVPCRNALSSPIHLSLDARPLSVRIIYQSYTYCWLMTATFLAMPSSIHSWTCHTPA